MTLVSASPHLLPVPPAADSRGTVLITSSSNGTLSGLMTLPGPEWEAQVGDEGTCRQLLGHFLPHAFDEELLAEMARQMMTVRPGRWVGTAGCKE